MDLASLFKTVNWRTAAYGIGYAACKIVGGIYPAVGPVCEVLETLVVSGGLLSAADSSRVAKVVQAVDHLLFKNRIDPETLAPMSAVIEVKPTAVS